MAKVDIKDAYFSVPTLPEHPNWSVYLNENFTSLLAYQTVSLWVSESLLSYQSHHLRFPESY